MNRYIVAYFDRLEDKLELFDIITHSDLHAVEIVFDKKDIEYMPHNTLDEALNFANDFEVKIEVLRV